MTLVQTGMNMASKRLPKVIGPRTHAIIDYVVAGTFIGMGVFMWARHKRAAISSFICGGAVATNAMLTDFPGGVWKAMSFETHGRIDAGLVGAAASMPSLMGFKDDTEHRFFQVMALAEAGVTAMTDFDATERTDYYRNSRYRAA